MALPLALLALLVIGMVVAGTFTTALLEQRVGRNTLYVVQAAGAVEVGAATVVGEWSDHGLDVLAPGETVSLARVPLPDRTAYAASVTRLNGELFLVKVVGTRDAADGLPLARRAAGLIVRRSDSAPPGAPPVGATANRAWAWRAP